MRLHVHKKAIRVLGVSESFVKGIGDKSVLAGVVMRSDMIVDGFVFSLVTVGGMDSTEKIIAMYERLKRDDINLLMLNGCIISWYNVVDLQRLAEETSLPIICLTYEASEGLDKYFMELFPKDWKTRTEIYHRNDSRTSMALRTGYTVYARFLGLSAEETKIILNKFTSQGSIPEPLRIGRLLAAAIFRTLYMA